MCSFIMVGVCFFVEFSLYLVSRFVGKFEGNGVFEN